MRLRTLLWHWALVIAVLVVAMMLRYRLIEPAGIGFLCDPGSGPWWCGVRRMLVLSFSSQLLGYFALLMGVLALFTRSRGAALAAVAVGVAGLVLYCWEASAVGFLLGLLTLVRHQTRDFGQQDSSPQQHA